MAFYRQIHVGIWADEWFEELESDAKLLFIYLFSNNCTSPSGMYRITERRIAFDTGLPADRVSALLADFEAAGKVRYNQETHVLWVVNMRKYQASQSPKLAVRIHNDVLETPDCPAKIAYLERYPIDTLSIPSPDGDDKVPIPYGYSIPSDSDRTVTEQGKGQNRDSTAPPHAPEPSPLKESPDDGAGLAASGPPPSASGLAGPGTGPGTVDLAALREKYGSVEDETCNSGDPKLDRAIRLRERYERAPLEDRESEQMETWADTYGSATLLDVVEQAVKVRAIKNFGGFLRTKIEKYEPLH